MGYRTVLTITIAKPIAFMPALKISFIDHTEYLSSNLET